MQRSPEERIDAYLEGTLSRQEVDQFERDLAEKPDLARALSEELLLREVLHAMPPLEPPDGLEDRIALALGAVVAEEQKKENELLPRLRSALGVASWSVRGPAVAFGGVGNVGDMARPAVSGLSQMRWVLGPLAAREKPAPPPPKPLWGRVLKRALGR